MSRRLRTVAIILAISAVLLFGSGIWLTVAGRPYTTGAPYAIHELGKLLVYVLVIVAIVMAYRASRPRGLSASEWALFGFSVLFVLIATSTGSAFLGRAVIPSWELWLHRISPWVAAILFGLGWNSLAKRG